MQSVCEIYDDNIFTEPAAHDDSAFVEEELKRVEDELGSQLQLMHTDNPHHKPEIHDDTPVETELKLT